MCVIDYFIVPAIRSVFLVGECKMLSRLPPLTPDELSATASFTCVFNREWIAYFKPLISCIPLPVLSTAANVPRRHSSLCLKRAPVREIRRFLWRAILWSAAKRRSWSRWLFFYSVYWIVFACVDNPPKCSPDPWVWTDNRMLLKRLGVRHLKRESGALSFYASIENFEVPFGVIHSNPMDTSRDVES